MDRAASLAGRNVDLMCSTQTDDDCAELRLTQGYVRICVAPPNADGVKTVSLARFGHYDVRLLEFVPEKPTEPTPIWLELYNHETRCGIDSYRCYDLEAAVRATEELIARARQAARFAKQRLSM
jgi:hypothetical protein